MGTSDIQSQKISDSMSLSVTSAGWNRAAFYLEIDLPTNNVHDVAANPNFFAVLTQMDAAGALESSALGRDIGRLGESCADEPLREARVEAAGDRVFVSAAA